MGVLGLISLFKIKLFFSDNKYILITSGSNTASNRRSEVIDAIDDTKRCADLPDFPVADMYLPPGGVSTCQIIV